MLALQETLFDYAALDAETRITVQQRTTEIKALMKRAASDIIEIGQKLIEVKGRLPRGHFDGWIKLELGIGRSTAYRFIQVAETFGNSSQIGTIAPSAIQLLAENDIPAAAREEALERAEAGEPITHSLAREIVNSHKEPAEPADDPLWWDREYEPADAVAEYRPRICPYCGCSYNAAGQHGDATECPGCRNLHIYSGPRDTEKYGQYTGLQGPARVLLSSALNGGSNEWYTPPEYVDRARALMGRIDLDPASCEYANDNGVHAVAIWTQADDGLTQPWHGNVWCNPPYGKQVPAWVDRIISAHATREIDACCLLVNATTDVQWFQRLWDYPICFLEGRVPFYNDKGDDPAPTHGSVIVYFGDDIAGFASSFGDIGHIVVPAGLYSKVL